MVSKLIIIILIRQTNSEKLPASYNEDSTDASVIVFKSVCLELGTNLGEHVMNRILSHLKASLSSVYVEQTCTTEGIVENSLILSVGNSSNSLSLISNEDLDLLPFESFQIRGKRYNGSKVVLGCNGRPLDPNRHRNITFNKETVHYGAVVSAYACLELLGYAFLHPLSVYIPFSGVNW